MILEVSLAQGKLFIPVKMNLEWLKEEDFINKKKYVWEPFDGTLRKSNLLQFHQNIRREKNVVVI
jgi:hypothetical protein